MIELPGVPCSCLALGCFARYDLNNDSCITQDECDLQWPLQGNCTGTASYGPPLWDSDQDGCINLTEFEVLFAESNGACCPQEAPPTPFECPPGYYLIANPTECVECVGGEVRRRRALECTTCPDDSVDLESCSDDCVDTTTPLVINGPSPCPASPAPTHAPLPWIDPVFPCPTNVVPGS